MKYLVDERVEKGYPDEPLLTASQSRGVIPKADYGSRTVEAQKDLHLLKLVEPGDYVISLRSFQGGIEFAHVRGIISPAYTVLEPKSDVRRGYYEHFFKSSAFISSMTLFVTGIREGQNIDYVRLSRAYMPVPPPDEQDAIGRFIRHLDQRVNRLIKTKRRLIELLNEQKQAIIHRAVTRGLDPTVPLKPSGIDWLGDVPEHWSVKPLKRWASMNAKTLTDKTPSDFEFRYLDIGTVGTGRLVREPEKMVFEGAPSRARRIVRSGDTIISTVRTYLKAMFFLENVEEPMIASTGFSVLSPTDAIVPRYLSYVIQSADFINRVTANSIGIAYPAISESRMGSFHLAAPGKAEQLEILAHLDGATEPFDRALSKAQSEIDLIREYRTRLVADVVTGQLDVRDHPWANTEPEPLEPEPLEHDGEEEEEDEAGEADL